MYPIQILHTTQGNLKDISVSIPKNKLTVLCGVSGSGKSTLAVDVLFQECQRQYLEAMGMEGITRPAVEAVKNVSPAILITQNDFNKNPRSSLGTVTDIYTDLRMIYEKLGNYPCPECGQMLQADACREETEKIDDEFYVYMYCPHCGRRIPKQTRSHFSYNTKEGACPTCQGLGNVLDIRMEAIVDETKSLEDGAILLWEYRYKDFMMSAINAAFKYYELPYTPGTPFGRLSELQKRLVLYGSDDEKVRCLAPPGCAGVAAVATKESQLPFVARSSAQKQPPKTLTAGRLPGVIPGLYKRLSEKGGLNKQLEPCFIQTPCPDCGGERLNEISRSVTVAGIRLPELSRLSLEELKVWLETLKAELTDSQKTLTQVYLTDLKTKIHRILGVGLGYLSLNRQTMTLSGGEAQRIKLAAALDSELSGIIYILDEPTKGLHTQDTLGVVDTLKALRNKGNTVIVIEHDMDILRAADHIIEIGSGAGKLGGHITASGSFEDIMAQEQCVTARFLREHEADMKPSRPRRRAEQFVTISHGRTFNLKDVTARFGVGLFNVVTGVSGSGKSTLVFEELAKKRNASGLENFDQIITVEQSGIARMKRSNIATYIGAYTFIRDIFADQSKAYLQESSGELPLTPRHFSFNSKGGRCENCEGLGTITSNMLFFEDIEITCPVCHGKQFHEDILAVKYQGRSIHDVLNLSVTEASDLFGDHKKLSNIFGLLIEVGLGYITLGQSLTTLSGGEGQRLGLARELLTGRGRHRLYLIDEPTTGLHPQDILHFTRLLHRLCDEGNTLIIVEHNLQLIREADWIVDMGPQGGIHGGQVLAMGTVRDIRNCPGSVTGSYL